MVRFANEKDLTFLKHAWDVCFHDPVEFINWNFTRNFSCSNTLIAELDGNPASNLQLMPHRISLQGREYDINYVSGVATLPEYRKRGLVRELFQFSFPEMRRRKQPISLLIPFDYSFYEKFGYKQCYEKVFRYTEKLPPQAEVPEITPSLMMKLDRIYRFCMQGKTGYALRSLEDWRRILEDLLLISKGRLVFHETNGDMDGYALCSQTEEGEWEFHEVLGSCDLVFREETKPFAMARIVDAERILGDLAEKFAGSIRIKILDDMIPENNRTFWLADGKVIPCEEYDMELDIKELTQLVFGFCEDTTGTGLFLKTEPYLNLIF